MDKSIWDKLLENPWQFAVILLSAAVAFCLIGKGLVDFLDRIIKIIKTLGTEISGKSQAKFAAIFNILLLLLIVALLFLVISPSLLSQLGFVEIDSKLGYYVVLIIAFMLTGIWSGHFIRQFQIEENAYKTPSKTGEISKNETKLANTGST